jgi:hypothetical protein
MKEASIHVGQERDVIDMHYHRLELEKSEDVKSWHMSGTAVGNGQGTVIACGKMAGGKAVSTHLCTGYTMNPVPCLFMTSLVHPGLNLKAVLYL